MKNIKEIESFFHNTDPGWWNPDCDHDNRFWFFKAQSEYISTQLKKHAPVNSGVRALDAGCGRGIHSLLLQNLGYEVVSMDINQSMLYLTGNIVNSKLVKGSLMKMPFKDEAFKVILSIGTSMHVSSVTKLMSEIYRVLSPDGLAVVSISNKYSLYVIWTTRINRILAKHQQLYHCTQFTHWSFSNILRLQKFKIIDSMGFAVVPPISLKLNWQRNIISPFMSKCSSRPFDWFLGRYFGCGVTFIVKKNTVH